MASIIKKVTEFCKKDEKNKKDKEDDECNKSYTLGKTFGTGAFATVKSAISKADNSRWAVKCFDKTHLDLEQKERLREQVEILQMVKHPNIVQLREVFDCQKTFYMVMEEMSGGELFDRIVEKEKYSEKEASSVVKKLAAALLYCHEKGIVHRDLKPDNVMYQSPKNDAEIKIADFGLAKLVKGDSLMRGICGTPGYVAPEILERKPYGQEVDLWSLGVITYILLCGFPPFYNEDPAALFASIKWGVFKFPSPHWDSISASAKDLISRLLVVDAKERFTVQQVLDHAWVSDIHNVSDEALPLITAEMKRYNARRRFCAGIMPPKIIGALSMKKEPNDMAADVGVAPHDIIQEAEQVLAATPVECPPVNSDHVAAMPALTEVSEVAPQ